MPATRPPDPGKIPLSDRRYGEDVTLSAGTPTEPCGALPPACDVAAPGAGGSDEQPASATQTVTAVSMADGGIRGTDGLSQTRALLYSARVGRRRSGRRSSAVGGRVRAAGRGRLLRRLACQADRRAVAGYESEVACTRERGPVAGGVVVRSRRSESVPAARELRLHRGEPEPDIMVCRADLDRSRHPSRAELVIEVAASSLVRDLEVKPSVYAEATADY